jgi:type I restriction enzyme S subunit
MAKAIEGKLRQVSRTTLGEQVEFQKGYAFKSVWYRDVGQPIVKVSDFTDYSVDSKGLVCIPTDIAQNYLKHQLQTGDVVIQTVGSWPNNPASVVGKAIRIPPAASGALLNRTRTGRPQRCAFQRASRA